MLRRFLVFALLASVASSSRACLNDRDSDAASLADANARFPDALRVITGRFERNPPRFYQMRIARVKGELNSKPRDFGLYDDLAVAHDKLGDDETALKIMARKRALLPLYNAHDKALKEAWYRFFANDGTFRAHRFLKGGAKVERIGEMKRARDEIKRAIQIKPNAHFGRERVQLMVMDWIVAIKQGKARDEYTKRIKPLSEWIYERDNKELEEAGDGTWRARTNENREGLSGLVALGAAWQSPDVFEALSGTMDDKDSLALGYLTLLRCDELLRNGHVSLAGLTAKEASEMADSHEPGSGVGINAANAQTLRKLYPQMRTEADSWNASRAKWMEARFAQGEHPDTDANFWKGWKEPPAPQLDKVRWWNEHEGRFEGEPAPRLLWSLAPIFGVLALSFWVLKRRRTQRRAV